MYDESKEISLSEQGGATGILFSAAQVYSAYGGSMSVPLFAQVLCNCIVWSLARLLSHSLDSWNVYARRYGEATAYSSGAPWIEGDTFDECGGHASSTSHSSYHVHVPPTCLLKQLNADNSQHSPQIGWSLDGFPICTQHNSIGAFLMIPVAWTTFAHC